MTPAVQRGDAALWLHDAAEVIGRYRPGRMEWEIRDPLFTGLTLRWEVIPLAATEGFAGRLTARGAQSGDRLIWAFGGATPCGDASKAFDPVVIGQNDKELPPFSPVLQKRFQPDDNTWPTDSVWYSGGGSAEESAYAFAG